VPISDQPHSIRPIVTDPTSRQVQVLAAVVATGSNKGAAYLLGISSHTIRNHLTALRQKLDVETNLQAAYVLTARGVLVIPTVGRRAA
jgi:DNA-binding NarL/FixJ family response regulator